MQYLLTKTMKNISSLRHFYDIQRKYIENKSKQGMKKNRMGFLTEYYFNILVHGSEEEKSYSTFANLKQIIEQHIIIKEISDNGVVYQVKEPDRLSLANIPYSSNEYQKYAEMPIMHGDNTLIMLITRFEEFISDFIKLIYKKFPQKYLDKQTITFSEITNTDIEGIQQRIVNREVDHIMRESYQSWFELFESHGMKFEYCASEYKILKELYARRNILVHNSGIVNDSYIKNVPDTTYSIDDRLYADEEYLNQAFEAVKTIIYCILIEAVRIEEKAVRNSYINDIFQSVFDELVAENYGTCKTVFYSLAKSGYVDEMTKTMSKINYWISKIESDGLECVMSDIENLDVSALDKVFSLAKKVLLKDYKVATAQIERLYETKELPIYAVQEWPLFKRYRESKEYEEFKIAHPELADVVALETKSENLMTNDETKQIVRIELKDSEITEGETNDKL